METVALLMECKDVARTLQLRSEQVKFNKSLCTLLATTYSRSLNGAVYIRDLSACETTVTELRRILSCGEMLVAQWSDKNWWKSLISSSDSASIQEKLFLHLDEFLFCVKVLMLNCNDVVAPYSSDLLTKDVEAASLFDLEILLRTLEMYRTSLPRGDESKLVDHVLDKIRPTSPGHVHLLSIEYDDVKREQILGQGSFGAVFKCEYLGLPAAAKVFVVSNRTSVSEVKKEADLLARLRHPNVVQFVGYVVKGSEHVIVSELMSMDLRRYLDENVHEDQSRPPLPLLLAVDIMLQVAEAMKYLHESMVMHRDLKANNVLINIVETQDSRLSSSLQVKITDFGLSKLNLNNSRFTTRQVGATPWRAPEVFEDEENTEKYTNAADVYSFALVFFEVLTGEVPFANIPRSQVLLSIRREERPTLPSEEYCPAHLSAIIKTCWATRAEDRPKFSEICQKLVEVKGRIMLQSYPNPSPYKPQKCINDSGYTGSIIAMGNTEKWFQGSGRIANISGWGFSEFPSCRFGYSSLTGKGDYMHVFHEISELDRQDIRLFTVVDGHGYRRAAYYIARHLFDNLLKHPKLFDDTKLAIVETYKQTDQDYLREEDDPQSIVGSTACTAVLVGKHLLIANVGDSRAVISRGGNAVTLSWDHKPTQTDEQKRIVDEGGILIWDGTWQVPGGGVSRAFGDQLLKQYVVAEPDIQEVTIEEGVDILFLASAVLWDVVSNQDAVSIVLEYISDVEEAANRLIEEACHRGSVKNITCVVVCFNLDHLLQSRS